MTHNGKGPGDRLRDGSGNWFLIAPHALPEEWRQRAVPVYMINLSDEVVSALLPAERNGQVPLDDEERAIGRLLSQGASPAEISRRLHLSKRSVFRRLARMRQLLEVQTNPELATKLAKHDI